MPRAVEKSGVAGKLRGERGGGREFFFGFVFGGLGGGKKERKED